MSRLLAIALAVASLAPGVALAAGAPAAPSDERMDYERLLSNQVSMLETLDGIGQDLEQRELELDKLQGQRQRIAVELIQLEVTFEDATSHLSQMRDLIRKRLRAVARHRRSARVELVFSLDAYFDSQRRERAIGLLLDDDKTRVATFREELERYERERATLDTKREELDRLEERVAGEKARLDRDKAQKQEILTRIDGKRKWYEKAYKELDGAYEAVTGRIAKLEQWQERKLEMAQNQGKLRLPMAYAAVVTGYGPQKNKQLGTTVMHRGLEIKTTRPGGTRNVRSVYWGRVAYVGWLVGYGNTVILDHTNGYHTLYARLASVEVKEGDIVETRGLIGQAGGAVTLGTAGTLYFELRHEGRAIDPTQWFMMQDR